MVNAIIRLIKFLLIIVPIMVAIVECNDDDDKDETPEPTIHAILPDIFAQHTAGTIVLDLIDGISENQLYAVESFIHDELHYTSDIHWAHEESRDEGIALVWSEDIACALERLQDHPLVEVAEPQFTLSHAPATFVSLDNYPDDPLYGKQWHMDAMGAPYGWKHTPRGKGVIVAVADTGVTIVKDLKNTHVLPGKSFVDNSPGTDRHGHGTHVAGTIAQSTNNALGTTGVAPAATILPVKVLTDNGYGSVDGIAGGIYWAQEQGAQVINLSLGGGYSKVIHNAIKKVTEQGVLVIAACGNDSTAQCGYPGGVPETLGVSATGPNGDLAFYSSYGKGVDIAAPGGDKSQGEEGGVLQNTVRGSGDSYEYFQGTSMATPHVVGAAAVLLSTGLNTTEVRELLLESADGDGWTEEFGHGKLNLEAAIKQSGTSPGGLGHNHIGLFTVAGLLALAVTVFSEVKRPFILRTVAVASVLGGGLFFLNDIPFLSGTLISLISTPLLEWPNIILFPGAANFPLWVSVAFPGVIAYVFGMHKQLRFVATGLCVGTGATLLWAGAAGTIVPWALPGILGTIWLTANGLACVTLGLGLCGAQHLEEVHDA